MRRRRTAESPRDTRASRPVHPQGPGSRGARSASVLAGGAGAGCVWVPQLSRLSPGTGADSGAPLGRMVQPRGDFPGHVAQPYGPGSEWVPSSPHGPNKMEDIVSSCSHDEPRVDVCPPQEHSGTPSDAARPPLGPATAPAQRRHARGIKELDKEGVGDTEAASLPGHGRWEPPRRPGSPGLSVSSCPGPGESPVSLGQSPPHVPRPRKSGRLT